MKVIKYIKRPLEIIPILSYKGAFRWLPDEIYLKLLFRAIMGKKLNLDNPTTYSEKLQWIKLYDRNPLYTRLVDKYQVKEYVKNKIGEKYIIPTIGVWDSFDQIDFLKLPEQFVMKCTHDSGGLIICKDKSQLDKAKAKHKIEKYLHKSFYWFGREWPYKNVQPRIIVEQYMEDKKTKELRDYKFFAFNGVVKAVFIATERQNSSGETKFDFFDENFNHLNLINGHPNADITPEKPICFEEMKLLASQLSEGLPEARIDFYEVDGCVYFGEITFFHWSGLKPFVPEEWDEIFGGWIKLPEQKGSLIQR